MTAQMPDQFFYKDHKLDLVGIKGSELTVPIDLGVETMMASTACYRGYVMRYRVIENRLVLEGFWFATKMDDLPEINGVKPIKLSEETAEEGDWMHTMFQNEYKNLDLTVKFTGSLWLAKDFIDSEYVHMGFQSPTAYKTVLKFDFKDGIIINVEDKSKETEEAREKGTCKEPQPKSMDGRDLEEWIMKRFSLDIDFYKKEDNGD